VIHKLQKKDDAATLGMMVEDEFEKLIGNPGAG
jgi:hypothetical protein